MQHYATRQRTAQVRWLRLVNYALAGIFGLVMPFVCWGAEATPGHPHGRAHLVFLAPPVVNQHQSLWAGRNAHDVLAAASSAKTIGQHELCTTPSAPSGATSPMTPVGKSTPLVLAVTLLLLTLFETKILPARRDDGGFARRPIALHLFTPSLAIDTPPPR